MRGRFPYSTHVADDLLLARRHIIIYTSTFPNFVPVTLAIHLVQTMATTGLASSATTKFDAVTPPKPSSLPADLVGQLLVNLDKEIEQLKSDRSKLDLEGLLDFQRVANYL